MMKLKVQQVFAATPVLGKIIAEGRPLPGKGTYRVQRMHAALTPEWDMIARRYNQMVLAYGHKRHVTPDGRIVSEGELPPADAVEQDAVPEDKMEEFSAAWGEIAVEEIEVNIAPIPLDQLCFDGKDSSISFAEFATLGELVAE